MLIDCALWRASRLCDLVAFVALPFVAHMRTLAESRNICKGNWEATGDLCMHRMEQFIRSFPSWLPQDMAPLLIKVPKWAKTDEIARELGTHVCVCVEADLCVWVYPQHWHFDRAECYFGN